MSRKSIIPKSETQIFGRTVKIYYKEAEDKTRIVYGMVNLNTAEIFLRKETKGIKVNKDELEITYLHEIMHYILHKTGYSGKLERANINEEEFVEMVAVGLYDSFKNSK